MGRAATARAARPKGANRHVGPAAGAPRAEHAGRRRRRAGRTGSTARRAPGRLRLPASAAAAVRSGGALPFRLLNARRGRALRARTVRVLDALLSGRGWIALIGVLLTGIVFLNVGLLQMNRGIARDAERASALRRENARLRLDVARLASSERIQAAAARLGLVLPAPGEVRYLKARPELDARRAAKRITEPNPALAPPPPTSTAPEADGAVAPPAPGLTAPEPTGAPATTTVPPTTPPATTTPPAGTAGAPTATTPPTGTTTTPAPTVPQPTVPPTTTGQTPPPATGQPAG